MQQKNKHNILHIAAIFIAAMFLLSHCTPENIENAQNNDARDTTLYPIMYGNNIQALISDSGNIKVRITSKEFQKYKTDSLSYWLFPQGLFLERFNDTLGHDAEIVCKFAKYFDKKEFWELRDSVVAKNSLKEVFETEILFWNQKTRLVYTDEYIRITRPGKDTIEGTGFESTQDFSKWEIKNTNAIFKMDIEE